MRFDYDTKEWKFDDCVIIRGKDVDPVVGQFDRKFSCMLCPNIIIFRKNPKMAFLCDDCIFELDSFLDNIALHHFIKSPRLVRTHQHPEKTFCKLCSTRLNLTSNNREPICQDCLEKHIISNIDMTKIMVLNRLSAL